MLDTGIDIPEILNLVFFKKVKSYSKFWQMIGRGTRLCADLYGPGLDKKSFLIFDFCNNFDFFREGLKGCEAKIKDTLSEKIFNCKVNIARELQAPEYQAEEDYAAYRVDLTDELNQIVVGLDDTSFRVKQHMRYVETYRNKLAWANLESIAVSDIKEHIAPLVVPKKSDEFERLLEKDFWKEASILDLEYVREALRELIKYIETGKVLLIYSDFEDNIVDYKEGEVLQSLNDLKDYKKKVEYYLKEHLDNLSVYKLRHNKKLTKSELAELERVLWKELGTREEYQKEYGNGQKNHDCYRRNTKKFRRNCLVIRMAVRRNE